jgi:hypothetical protein
MSQSLIRITLVIILQLGFYFHSNFTSIALSNHIKCIKHFNKDSENPVLLPKDIIFEVRHSKSPNVVVYQANKTLQKLLNPDKPIDVYWLMNTKGKKTEALTSIEWRMAFGYKLTTVIRGKKYKIKLNAIENKEITILQNETGKVEAYMIIKGAYSKLIGVYIDFEYSFFLPQVNYVEFSGIAVNSNKKSVERIVSES